MSEWYVLGGLLLILLGLWIVTVELRLKAASLLGEILLDDMKERGLVSKDFQLRRRP